MSRLSLVTAGCLDAHIIGFPSQSVARRDICPFCVVLCPMGILEKVARKPRSLRGESTSVGLGALLPGDSPILFSQVLLRPPHSQLRFRSRQSGPLRVGQGANDKFCWGAVISIGLYVAMFRPEHDFVRRGECALGGPADGRGEGCEVSSGASPLNMDP